MGYLNDLQRIKKVLLELDNMSYDTIEEADNCLIKYDKLKDEIVLIIEQAIENYNISDITKESIYNEAIRLLTNYIGSADDIQKYETILKSFYNEGMLTKHQLHSFYDNLDIGRWR